MLFCLSFQCLNRPNSGFAIGGYRCVCRDGFHSAKSFLEEDGYASGADLEKAFETGNTSHFRYVILLSFSSVAAHVKRLSFCHFSLGKRCLSNTKWGTFADIYNDEDPGDVERENSKAFALKKENENDLNLFTGSCARRRRISSSLTSSWSLREWNLSFRKVKFWLGITL